MLGNYVNEIDMDQPAAFSAVCCYLGDGTVYVAYRGTDNGDIGMEGKISIWDFSASTSGQRRAVRYLNVTTSRRLRPSAGRQPLQRRNLAVYASSFMNRTYSGGLQKVYTERRAGVSAGDSQGSRFGGSFPGKSARFPNPPLWECFGERCGTYRRKELPDRRTPARRAPPGGNRRRLSGEIPVQEQSAS